MDLAASLVKSYKFFVIKVIKRFLSRVRENKKVDLNTFDK